MPVGERNEGRDSESRTQPRRRDERLAADAGGEIARGQETQHRHEIPRAEDDPDVLRARPEVPQVERPDRGQKPEPTPEQHLRSGEDPDIARELQLRPFTTPRARRSSNSVRALRNTSGSASTSIAVSASALPAASALSCASCASTASRKAIEWPGIGSGDTAMYGWIAGSTCITLPMSVEPTRSSSRAS